MKSFLTAAALLAATASADLCAHGSTDDNGNYYCQQVNAITYTGVGGSGSYNKVTSMDGNSGTCQSSPNGYSGSLAPFDEEVSMHFRGPLKLLQFAYYSLGNSTSSSKRSIGRKSAHERRHAHGHAHQHLHHARDAQPAEDKRALGDMVTATIDGQVQTWANQYAGGYGASSSPTAAANSPEGYGSGVFGGGSSNSGSSSSAGYSPPSYGSSSSAASSSASSSSSSDDSDDSNSSGSGWTRKGYYSATDGKSDGLVFLNHEGGSGSGTFDYTFGNSLSYASADGKSGSSSPQTLEACTIDDDTEVVIMTDDKCDAEDSSCGYYRDGTVAYHGFDGPSKAFFFEFQMPDSGKSSASIYDPVNMPAIWMLNAQIPRTLQYGKAECSCWTSGCGEFDIFEVLAPGDKRCKSTIHGNIAGGDSDYFARPESAAIKAAVLLYKDNFHIKIIDDSTTFGETMPESFFAEMIADSAADSLSNLVSLFKLGGS